MKKIVMAAIAALALPVAAQQTEREAVCRTLQPYFGQNVWVITSGHASNKLTPAMINDDRAFWEGVKRKAFEKRVQEQKEDRELFPNMPHQATFLTVRAALMRRWSEFPDTNALPTPVPGRTAEQELRATERKAAELAQNLGFTICMEQGAQ